MLLRLLTGLVGFGCAARALSFGFFLCGLTLGISLVLLSLSFTPYVVPTRDNARDFLGLALDPSTAPFAASSGPLLCSATGLPLSLQSLVGHAFHAIQFRGPAVSVARPVASQKFPMFGKQLVTGRVYITPGADCTGGVPPKKRYPSRSSAAPMSARCDKPCGRLPRNALSAGSIISASIPTSLVNPTS
jgi:hypothetical protein